VRSSRTAPYSTGIKIKMSQGFQFFDIILFAMIAIFLILRLRNALGRRDGHEGGFTDVFNRKADKKQADDNGATDNNNVVQLPDATADEDTEPAEPATPLEAGIAGIAAASGGFDTEEFASGARIAFELILGSYASGDSKALKPLLSPEVYANFEHSIREREAASQTMEETLVGIRKAEVVEAYLEGTVANVTVKFISDQVHALSNAEGEVVDGDPNRIIDVTDYWTFARDTRSGDPNWALVATRSQD
jgi:predicted lipid-binding transport protein (Tim44 family)